MEGRPYRSDLRSRHVTDARARILDATVRVMAAGVATVSIPSVARQARVSIPTIYRYFPTKRDLLAAVYPHIERRAGLKELAVLRTIDDRRPAPTGRSRASESFPIRAKGVDNEAHDAGGVLTGWVEFGVIDRHCPANDVRACQGASREFRKDVPIQPAFLLVVDGREALGREDIEVDVQPPWPTGIERRDR